MAAVVVDGVRSFVVRDFLVLCKPQPDMVEVADKDDKALRELIIPLVALQDAPVDARLVIPAPLFERIIGICISMS